MCSRNGAVFMLINVLFDSFSMERGRGAQWRWMSRKWGLQSCFARKGSLPKEASSSSRYKHIAVSSANHLMDYICQEFPEWGDSVGSWTLLLLRLFPATYGSMFPEINPGCWNANHYVGSFLKGHSLFMVKEIRDQVRFIYFYRCQNK